MSAVKPGHRAHPSKRLELVAVQSTLIGVAFIVVVLRLVTRFYVVKSPGKDDYAIVFATVMAIAETGLTLSVARHGAGLHNQSPEDILYTMKVFYVARILYSLAVTAIKVSILLLYLRIFPGPWIRRSVKAVMSLAVTGTSVLLLLWIFKCRPISHAWHPASHGTCLSKGFLFQAATIFSLIVNVIIIALPMPIIWGLHMSMRRRLLVFGIFGIGLMQVLYTSVFDQAHSLTVTSPCASLIARLMLPITARKFEADPTWWIVYTEDWVLAEYTTGLICASLIHLKPLVKRFVPHALGSSRKGSGKSNSGVQEASPHVRQTLKRMDDRKYGYASPTRTTPYDVDGAHDCHGEDTSLPTTPDSLLSPRLPEKVYAWAPKVCHRPEAPLIRHASPV